MRPERLAALCLVLTIAGCDRSDPRICTTPKPLEDSLKERDAAFDSALTPDQIKGARAARMQTFALQCVHRWAYRLAASRTSADRDAAEGARNACEEPIREWARTSWYAYQLPYPSELRDARALAFDWALFHIVQAKAGNCRIPE